MEVIIPPAAAVAESLGKWTYIDGAKLAGNNTVLCDIQSITAYNMYKLFIWWHAEASLNPSMRFNDDSSNSYAYGSVTNADRIQLFAGPAGIFYYIAEHYIMNIQTLDKGGCQIAQHHRETDATAPSVVTRPYMWDNTVDLINRIKIYDSAGSKNFKANSFVEIWGANIKPS